MFVAFANIFMSVVETEIIGLSNTNHLSVKGNVNKKEIIEEFIVLETDTTLQ